MNRIQRDGACVVWLSNGTQILMERSCFSELQTSIQRADAHFVGAGLYGAPVMFSVPHVVMCTEETPEAQAALAADHLVP